MHHCPEAIYQFHCGCSAKRAGSHRSIHKELYILALLYYYCIIKDDYARQVLKVMGISCVASDVT
jgi:hypothetical protein